MSTPDAGWPVYQPFDPVGAGGFSTGGIISTAPEVLLPLQTAQAVATGLAGKLRQHVTDTMANAAVANIDLQDKLAIPIQRALGDSAQAAVTLQHPILTQVAGAVGSAMEGAYRVGAIPPDPNNLGIMPMQVQIRQSALNNDYGPALEAYRETAAPLKDYGGLQYAAAVQKITNALPQTAAAQTAFATAVAQSSAAPGPLPPGQNGTTYDECITQAGLTFTRADLACQKQFAEGTREFAACHQAAYQQFLADSAACGSGQGGIMGGPGSVPVTAPPAPLPGSPPVTGGTAPGWVAPGPTAPPGVAGGPPTAPPTQGPAPQPVPIPAIPPGPAGGGPVGLPPMPPVAPVTPPPDLGPPTNTPPAPTPTPPLTPLPPLPTPGPGPAPVPTPTPPPPTPPPPPPPPPPPLLPPPCDVSEAQDLAQTVYDATGSLLAAIEALAANGYHVSPRAGDGTCPSGNFGQIAIYNKAGSLADFALCIECPPSPLSPPKPMGIRPGQADGCAEFGPIPEAIAGTSIGDLSKILGIRNDDGTLNISWMHGHNATFFDPILYSIITGVAQFADQIANTVQTILSNSGCVGGNQVSLLCVDLVAGLAERWLGIDLHMIREPNAQQRNYLCPTGLPDASQAASAWLGNTIDDKTLECWVRAAGTRFSEFDKVIKASRAKFTATEIGSLFLRDQLDDAELATRLRELGLINDSDVAELKELIKQIPPTSDLVRFMVRDAGDLGLVNQFGMDDDFDAKYSQQIKDWAKAQGVSDEYMQYVWRSHWSIPAPQQLFQMLQRSASLDSSDPGYVSIEDVKTALEQQDILPYWIPKFLAISYHPFTRIDAQRAYQIGAIDRSQLIKAYTDIGYNDSNAGILADYNDKKNTIAYQKNPVVKQYATGLATDEDFDSQLSLAGAQQADIDLARQRAVTISQSASRKSCVVAVKRRYLLADIEDNEVQSLLIGYGVPIAIAQSLASGWACERAARGKPLAASDLAALYSQGVIDAAGLVTRFQRLGYTYEDSILLQRKISNIQQQKVSKEEQANIRKQEAADIKQQKAIQTATNKSSVQQQKESNKLLSMQKTNVMREKRLIEAGQKLEKSASIPLGDAVVATKSLYRSYLNQSSWLPDEIIAAIVTAASDVGSTTIAAFQAAVSTVLTA